MISKLGLAKAIKKEISFNNKKIITGFLVSDNEHYYLFDCKFNYYNAIVYDSLCYNTDIIDEDGHEIYSNDVREIMDGNDRGKQFRIYYIPGGFVIKDSLWLFNLDDFNFNDRLISNSIVGPQILSWILNATKHIYNCKLDI